MTYWDGIIACGLADHPLVCMADLLETAPAMDEVKRLVSIAFRETFGYEPA
jgi:lipoate-protein ligase B